MCEIYILITVVGTSSILAHHKPHTPITKMKSFIVLALFAAVAVAVPVDPKNAETIEYVNDNIGVGGFNYRVKTDDGKFAEESGVLKNVGTENEAMEVTGSFSYTGVDGVVYSVRYIANELGFQPQGAHLPVAPV